MPSGRWAIKSVHDSTLSMQIARIFARTVANAKAHAAPVAGGRVVAPAGAELPEVRPAGGASVAVCASVLGPSVSGRGLLLFLELLSCLAIFWL